MTSLSELDDRSNTILSAEAGWAPPAQMKAVTHRARTAVVGAAVAAAICLLIAGVGWQIAPEGWMLGIAGLPVTSFLAWRMSSGVVATDRSGAVLWAFGLAVGTILITDALVIVVALGGAAVGLVGTGMTLGGGDPVTSIIGALGFGLVAYVYGAVIVGIPVAVVVIPAALVWAALLRRIVGRMA